MRVVSRGQALKNDLRESADERQAVLEQTRATREKLVRLQTAHERRSGLDRRWRERRHLKR